LDRDLTNREREILDFLLSVDFADVEILRAQASTARAVGRCPCGCATIEIAVDPGVQAFRPMPMRVPVEARVHDVSEPQRVFELLLFVDDGRISSLEIVWYGTDPPHEFPTPEDFATPLVHPTLLENSG
jgi:hypothetical protein